MRVLTGKQRRKSLKGKKEMWGTKCKNAGWNLGGSEVDFLTNLYQKRSWGSNRQISSRLQWTFDLLLFFYLLIIFLLQMLLICFNIFPEYQYFFLIFMEVLSNHQMKFGLFNKVGYSSDYGMIASVFSDNNISAFSQNTIGQSFQNCFFQICTKIALFY